MNEHDWITLAAVLFLDILIIIVLVQLRGLRKLTQQQLLQVQRLLPLNPSSGDRQETPPSQKEPPHEIQNFLGDEPFCDTCGHITVRHGIIYRCHNCGASVPAS